MPLRSALKSRLLSDRSLTGGRLALAGLFVLFGCSSLQNAVAEGDTRTLTFVHTHRDDSITVTFKRNGRYDTDALKKLNYFLRDWRNDQQTEMAPQLFDILWDVSQDVGAKQGIHIISSYRSPATNAMLRRRSRGVAQFSQHMLGKAIDFNIPGVPLEQLRYAALRLQRGGVGFYPTSGSPFVHVDVGGVRHWPRMTHDQLARVFPNGKTIHVPSDGHPLKNYQVALAEVQRRGGTPGGASLAAAHNAGIHVADAGAVEPQRGGNFLARIFGARQQDDEDETEGAPAPATKVAAAPAAATAAIPLPRSRPARPGEFALASDTSTPVPSANDVVSSRGFWQRDAATRPEAEQPEAADQPATPVAFQTADATPGEAIGPSGERLAWSTGPQAAPRPPRDIEGEPPAEATASVTAWTSNPSQNDRVPPDLALAYAAAAHPEPAAMAAPMGSLRAAAPVAATLAPPAPVAAAAPVAPTLAPPAPVAAAPTTAAPAGNQAPGNATVASKKPAANPPAARIAQRGNDPWLRGIVVTPSVHHSLSVNVLGMPDYRTLRPLMQKPRTTVAMVFSNDPTLGLTSLQFSGAAVAFLPTIRDTTRTAGLN